MLVFRYIANAWCSVPPPHVPPLVSLPRVYCTPSPRPRYSSSVIGIPLFSAPATAHSQQLPSPHVYCGTPMSRISSSSTLLAYTAFTFPFSPDPPLRLVLFPLVFPA
eukprot:840472-Pleurochrysis_carterae.AAC.1